MGKSKFSYLDIILTVASQSGNIAAAETGREQLVLYVISFYVFKDSSVVRYNLYACMDEGVTSYTLRLCCEISTISTYYCVKSSPFQ